MASKMKRNFSTSTDKKISAGKTYFKDYRSYKPYTKSGISKSFYDVQLDSLTLTELEHLKEIIEKKRREKQLDRHASNTKPYSLENYSLDRLGLRRYKGKTEEPIYKIKNCNLFDYDKIFFYEEDLLKTDLLFKYRQCLDSLSWQEAQSLVISRIFSLNNSPCLTFTLAMIDEACTYVKYHYIHDLPVNPQDVFMYTISVARHELYNKINMVKLPCILNEYGLGDIEYRVVKQLCGKSISDLKIQHIEQRIQNRAPETFRYPLQQAISIVITFEKIVRKMKNEMRRTGKPQFLRHYDINRVCEFYNCGMITHLIMEQLTDHKCSDVGCQLRIQQIMSSWKPNLYFCPYPSKNFIVPNFDLNYSIKISDVENDTHVNLNTREKPIFTECTASIGQTADKIKIDNLENVNDACKYKVTKSFQDKKPTSFVNGINQRDEDNRLCDLNSGDHFIFNPDSEDDADMFIGRINNDLNPLDLEDEMELDNI